MQNNVRDVHEEYIFLYCHACRNSFTPGGGDATTQSEYVSLINNFCLLKMDISASDLMKVEESRTYKPLMARIRY